MTKYKIIADIDISGSGMGDVIEAEQHAMEIYIERNQVEKYVEPIKKPAPKKKVVRRRIVKKK